MNVIKAVGRSDLYLRLEIIQTVIGILLLIPVIKLGPIYIALMYMVAAVLNAVIIGTMSGCQMGYSIGNQAKDMLPYYCMSAVMALVVWSLGPVSDNHLILLGQVAVGILIYVVLSVVFKPTAYRYIISAIRCKNEPTFND